jgi:hypothetical protein
MKRTATCALASCAIALLVGACDDQRGHHESYGVDPCQTFSTCGTCTPIDGCGWCFSSGSGACLSSPDECATAYDGPVIWTWDLGGCADIVVASPTVAADASVSDAGTDAPVDATVEAAVEASVPDAGADGGAAPP